MDYQLLFYGITGGIVVVMLAISVEMQRRLYGISKRLNCVGEGVDRVIEGVDRVSGGLDRTQGHLKEIRTQVVELRPYGNLEDTTEMTQIH